MLRVNLKAMNLDTPLWQLTVREFKELLKSELPAPEVKVEQKKYVYGLEGLAEIFGCTKATAWRIKDSGKIDKAISQAGRKIVVDKELALKLYKLK